MTRPACCELELASPIIHKLPHQLVNTTYIKELGYDGIKDVGGKNGGDDEHTVWIPFSSEQIKRNTTLRIK